jgi:inner membrane protein
MANTSLVDKLINLSYVVWIYLLIIFLGFMFLAFMSITHSLIAAAGTSLILGTADPMALGLAVLGSQLPDIDTTTSTIGKIFFPLSSFLEDRFPHRSITHSLLATGLIAAVSLPIGYFLGNWFIAIALPLGHLLACFSDCFTKQGVQLFFPDPAWAISVSNPNRRIRTGSTAEYWVLVAAAATLVLGIWLATGGGAVQKVSQQLGLKDGILAAYNQNAATHHVYADIQGVRASDRADASGRYFILGTAGSEFVVTDGKGVYKTNEQIITSKLTTEVGEAATTQVRTLTFNDQEAITSLKQLQAAYPNAAIYLSGSVTVDFPEEVKLPILPDQYQTVSLSGSSVNLEYCGIEGAIAVLSEQYAVGTVTAKIISPRPDF